MNDLFLESQIEQAFAALICFVRVHHQTTGDVVSAPVSYARCVLVEDEALDLHGFESIACHRNNQRIEVSEHLDQFVRIGILEDHFRANSDRLAYIYTVAVWILEHESA